jgi:hypothetical protein
MGTVVEAIEKQDFWVKVRVNNTVGWAASTAMERLMDTPAPDLAFVHSGYKVIGNTYRYFFGIRNSGLASYTDPVMLSLYNNGKVIFTHTSTFASDPIRASGGRSFSVDTDAKATRFEFAMKQGKSSGPIGKLIERMSYSSDTSVTGGGSMTPRRQYRGRFCGRVLNAWLPVAKRPESSMLRYHLGQHHLEAVGLYLTYMETECINGVLVEIFEMVEE